MVKEVIPYDCGVKLITIDQYEDNRGWFMPLWDMQCELEAELGTHFQWDNLSDSRRGVFRGLHIQNPDPQAKLVRCAYGTIQDFVVDLRMGPTFGKIQKFILDKPNVWLFVPKGMAHGFHAFTRSQVHYKVDRPFNPTAQMVLKWDDPALGLTKVMHPTILSTRDAVGLPLSHFRSK